MTRQKKPVGLSHRSLESDQPEPRPQFQVVLDLVVEPCGREQLENLVTEAVSALVEDARGLALGPVGGANFDQCEIELEFTMEAVSPAVLHAKLGEVLRVLERRGFEYAGSTDTRLDPDRDLEYA